MTDVAIVTKADREAAAALAANINEVLTDVSPAAILLRAQPDGPIAIALAAHAHPLRVALEACVKVIETFQQEDLLAEGVHAGLRKGSEARDSGTLWRAISDSRTSAWSDAISFALDPYFSMWGGDEALRLARAALGQSLPEDKP